LGKGENTAPKEIKKNNIECPNGSKVDRPLSIGTCQRGEGLTDGFKAKKQGKERAGEKETRTEKMNK